jgi:dipeptidyl aminopeptidase/acylaminoacyl peptidase
MNEYLSTWLTILLCVASVSWLPINADSRSGPEQLGRVAFVAVRSPRAKGFDIFQVDADGSNLRLMTTNQKQYWRWNSCPAWSASGDKLAFVSSDERIFKASHAGIFIMDLPSGDVRVLFRDDEMCPQDPAWAPDGKHLVHRTISSLLYSPFSGGGAEAFGDERFDSLGSPR